MTISAYYRPTTLDEALALLAWPEPPAMPLGGGTVLNAPRHHAGEGNIAVVDLQALGLNAINAGADQMQVGATATLQALLEHPAVLPALRRVLELEATINLRQMATLAGRLVTADGRSPLATALLALDARLTWEPGTITTGLGDWLPLRGQKRPGLLITQVSWSQGAALAFETIARTPADRPLVCLAAAAWPSGRTRIALGGHGAAPVLAMDGPEPGGAETAARAAYSQAEDAWASAEYRQEMAGCAGPARAGCTGGCPAG